jgi:NAD(P)H-nitrite reductase large subunit
VLRPGQKGTILQRDKQTYAIAPHGPCDVVPPDMLRRLAGVAEKFDVQAMKITGATPIALIGLPESAIDPIWNDLGMTPGRAAGMCVRSVRACPGTQFCRLGQRDAMAMGLAWTDVTMVKNCRARQNSRSAAAI